MEKISLKLCALGIGFIALLGIATYGVYATYKQDFTRTESLTLEAPRAGLLMDSGAEVKLRGVHIGRVDSVKSVGKHAELKLAIEPKYLKLIPSNSGARIVPPTAFGAKYVDLVLPASNSAPIRAGGTIQATNVTVEVNVAFENLVSLLDAAEPAKVNSALNAVADALDNNGEPIGLLITATDQYLGELNPHLPQLQSDISNGASVLRLYQELTPGFLDTARNVTTTARTLSTQQDELNSLLTTFGSTADDFRTFLEDNGPQAVRLLNLMAPVTGLLEKYSPELSCTIKGAQTLHKHSLPVLGGINPGLSTTTRLHPSHDPYTYADRPVIGANNGPGCYGLPNLQKDQVHQKHIVANTGANPYVHPTNTRQVNPLAFLQLILGVN